jgi:hypothetical protein
MRRGFPSRRWRGVDRPRDRDRLYLIDYGQPDKDPKRTGTARSISVVRRSAGRALDLGRSPIGGTLMDGGQMAVTSEGPARLGRELRLLREGKLVATPPVPGRPIRRRLAFYVWGEGW